MEALESAVVRSCENRDAWEAKIAAGVHAALVFASKNPGPAQAMIIQLRDDGEPRTAEFERMLGHFSEMLGETTGTRPRMPASTDAAVIGSIAAVVSGHLHCGTAARLPDVAEDLIELSLLPYVGFEAARQWSTNF